MDSSTWIGAFPAVSLPKAPPIMRESKPAGRTLSAPLAQVEAEAAKTNERGIASTAAAADPHAALVSSVALLALVMRSR